MLLFTPKSVQERAIVRCAVDSVQLIELQFMVSRVPVVMPQPCIWLISYKPYCGQSPQGVEMTVYPSPSFAYTRGCHAKL